MSRFWNWCKSFFVKVQPVVQRVEPVVVLAVETADPSLKPKIDAAKSAYTGVQEVLHQKA